MDATSRIDQTPVRLSTKVTEDRQTPNNEFGSRMKNGLSATANAIASGASVAAPMVPGGAIISAAVSGSTSMGNSLASGQQRGLVGVSHGAIGGGTTGSVATTSSASTSSTTPVASSDAYSQGMALLDAQQTSNMQYLTLQNQMQQENQQYSSLSNVMKVRSDTAKNTIQNVH